jgi:hypothetical protein
MEGVNVAKQRPTTSSAPAPVIEEPTAEQLQLAIESVAGVATATVARSRDGRDRLRISLVPGEDPEAIAWTVAATLRERFAIALDPAAISARMTLDGTDDAIRVVRRIAPGPPGELGLVAPIPDDEGGEAVGGIADTDELEVARPAGAGGGNPLQRRRRPAITELEAEQDGDDIDITATLRLGNRVVRGNARGLRTRRGRWRAISEATLAALAPLGSSPIRGHVDHVTVLSATELAHVSVSVTLLTPRGEETYLGSALIHDDPDRAVMRATLDAINRRIEPWLDATAVGISEVS